MALAAVHRETLAVLKDLPRMTYDEFLAWKPEDLHIEWVDGALQYKPPVDFTHQDITIFLTSIMAAHAREQDAGIVSSGPFQMKLATVNRGREPDIIFLSTANLDRIQDNYLDGPADLAVEIVSPGGAIRDRGEKYAEYEAAGVREYWIIDPAVRRADFFVLDGDGRYNREPIDSGGIYRSKILNGFWIEVNWLWQRPLPSVLTVLKRLELI